jgi:hypothetical protein
MAEPVSWLLIEPGWQVVDAAGEDIGRVEAVTGDSNADIFDGLSIASGVLARPKYVPSENVGAITNGRVQLTLAASAVDQLGEYEEPAESIDVEGDAASHMRRAEADVVSPNARRHREGVVRRVLAWFGLVGRR